MRRALTVALIVAGCGGGGSGGAGGTAGAGGSAGGAGMGGAGMGGAGGVGGVGGAGGAGGMGGAGGNPDLPSECFTYETKALTCFPGAAEDFLQECVELFALCGGMLPAVVQCRIETPCADLLDCMGLAC